MSTDHDQIAVWSALAQTTSPLINIKGEHPHADLAHGVWTDAEPKPERQGYRLPSHEAGAVLLSALTGLRRGSFTDYLLDNDNVATAAEVKAALRTWLGLIEVTDIVPERFPTLIGCLANLKALAADTSVGADRYFASIVKAMPVDPALAEWVKSRRAKRRAAATAKRVARQVSGLEESVERRVYGAHLTVLRLSDETEDLAGQTLPVTDVVDFALSDDVVFGLEDNDAESPLAVPWKNGVRGAHAMTEAVLSAYDARRQRVTDAESGETRRRLVLTVGAERPERDRQHAALFDELIGRIAPAVQRQFRLAESELPRISDVVQKKREALEQEVAQ